MKPWLSTTEAEALTRLPRHTLYLMTVEHPEIVMARSGPYRRYRFRTVALIQYVYGCSEKAALKMMRKADESWAVSARVSRSPEWQQQVREAQELLDQFADSAEGAS